jgi:hypothetical protein
MFFVYFRLKNQVVWSRLDRDNTHVTLPSNFNKNDDKIYVNSFKDNNEGRYQCQIGNDIIYNITIVQNS